MNKVYQLRKTAKNELRQKTQVGNRKISKEPNTEIYTFNETYSVTLLTKMDDKVDISLGLTASRFRTIYFVSDTRTESHLLPEDLVEPNWLLSIPVLDSTSP